MAALRRAGRRIKRHWRWGREEGFGRLVEEDDLDPFTRVPNAYRRWRWRARHGVAAGQAMPIFLVGAQRSGTNMLVQGLQRCPEFEVHNENSRRAFDNYRLRPDATIARIISHSRARYVLLKPLIDSHRIDHLLDDLPVAPGRALWAYRKVDGRVRSALAKFGDANLRALKNIAEGEGGHRWEAQRISTSNLDLIRSFDYGDMTPATASALFWYVRNSLFFELSLHDRSDMLLVSYDAFLANPEDGMRAICRHIGFPWSSALTAHVQSRPPSAGTLDMDPVVRGLCDELQMRLDQARRTQGARLRDRPV